MNVHPLVVHFPIAFLSLYSVLEVFRIRPLTRQLYWFPLKSILVLAGTIGAYIALETGEIAEELIENPSLHDLLEAHEQYATIASYVYGFLALCYAVSWIPAEHMPQRIRGFIATLRGLGALVIETWIAPLLATVGFVLIVITGALGASMVYGPDIDPVVRMIYDALI